MSSNRTVPNTYMVFINLAVRDMAAAIKFYNDIGFVQNKNFSGDEGVMMSLPSDPENATAENPINVMLLTHKFFDTFLPSTHVRGDTFPSTPIHTQAINCLGMPSKSAIDSLAGKAQAAGGKVDVRPPQVHQNEGDTEPWMYGRCFTDLDGHLWETMFMDTTKMPRGPAAP